MAVNSSCIQILCSWLVLSLPLSYSRMKKLPLIQMKSEDVPAYYHLFSFISRLNSVELSSIWTCYQVKHLSYYGDLSKFSCVFIMYGIAYLYTNSHWWPLFLFPSCGSGGLVHWNLILYSLLWLRRVRTTKSLSSTLFYGLCSFTHQNIVLFSLQAQHQPLKLDYSIHLHMPLLDQSPDVHPFSLHTYLIYIYTTWVVHVNM